MFPRPFALFLLALSLLAGCADNRRNQAVDLAAAARFSPQWLQAGSTRLMSWSRIGQPGGALTVYIEGDGFAYINRNQISPDPTPRKPMVLRLATLDPSENVAYLARPCMYSGADRPAPECVHHRWWTTGRFAEEVVTAMDHGLDELKKTANASRIHLVGYSGGGAIAALLAARRTDIATLITLAGNLDHEAFTRFHRVTPLTDSLNPAQMAKKLVDLPQIHYIGGDDTIIPPLVSQSFLAALGDDRCARVVTLPDAQHDDGWLEPWPRLLSTKPQCKTTSQKGSSR